MKNKKTLAFLCALSFAMALTVGACAKKSNKTDSAGDESNTSSEGGGTSSSQSGGEVKKWTVTFDSQGGSPVSPVQVENGKTVAKPANPTRSDYDFTGWYQEAAAVTEFDFATPITSNWTLFAGWTASGGGHVDPPEPPVEGYAYYVSVGVHQYGLSVFTGGSLLENQTGEYYVEGLTVATDEALVFYDSENNPITEKIGPNSGDNNGVATDSGFKIHNSADNVTIYFQTWQDGGHSFWVTGYEDGGTPPEPPVGESYYVSIGGVEAELVTNTGATLLENQTGEYYAEYASVAKDAAVVFYDTQKNAITESIGPDSGDNNGVGSAGSFHIHNDAVNVTVYFKTWQDGGHSFWITGYEAGGSVVPDGAHGPEGSELVSWYIVGQGSLFSDSWSIEGGVQLYSNPDAPTDKGCILSLTIEVGNVFKVTNGTDWYGYDKVDQWDDPSNLGRNHFSAVSDGYGGSNIQCDITGVYDIYVNSSGNFWIQAAAELA